MSNGITLSMCTYADTLDLHGLRFTLFHFQHIRKLLEKTFLIGIAFLILPRSRISGVEAEGAMKTMSREA